MMIDVTVKTLDSQNHVFHLDDEVTVREFKEHIAESVNITADLQRLIYCGRVLQDEKRLHEYDVDGKVIHLVARAPPSVTQRNNSSANQNQGQGHGQNAEYQHSRMQFRQSQFHGNPMYVGSVSIPADVLEGHDWIFQPPAEGNAATGHLAIIHRMLDQANLVIDRLDNPVATTTTTSGSTESNESQPQQAESSSTNDDVETESTSVETSTTADTTPSGSQMHEETSEQPTARPYVERPPLRLGASSEALIPRLLSEAYEQMLYVQTRLRPYITLRLLSLDSNDNGTQNPPRGTPEQNQQIIDGVTECLHFLSHAQHALSDISVDMRQPSPRPLQCRPMLLQPSAILQAGLPIQVEAHISLQGHSDNSNADSEDSSNNSTTSTRGTSGSAQATPTSGANETPSSQDGGNENPPPRRVPSFRRGGTATSANNTSNSSNRSESEPNFGSLFNFGNNVEFVMEMGPQAPRVFSFSPGGSSQTTRTANNNNTTTNNNNNNSNNNNNYSQSTGSGPTASVAGGVAFPWGGAPSPDIIRNLMQAVAGYMARSSSPVLTPTATTQVNTTSTSTPTPTSTPTVGCLRHRAMAVALGESTPSTGQSSQTRANTDTHPTTSTQTRTTPRTHVFHQHAQALGVGVAHSLDFDPFLPCNSQFIRRNQSTRSNTTSSTQTAQNASTTNNTSTPTTTTTTTNSADPPIFGSRFRRSNSVPYRVLFPLNFRYQSLAQNINELRRTNQELPISFHALLEHRGINLMNPRRQSGETSSFERSTTTDGRPRILREIYAILSRIAILDWFRILNGEIDPLTDEIRASLCQTIRDTFDSTDTNELSRQTADVLVHEIRPYLRRAFENEEASDENGREIDLQSTIESLIFNHTRTIVQSLLRHNEFSEVVANIRAFGEDITRILRYSLGGQAGLNRTISQFAILVDNFNSTAFRDWILGPVVDWFCTASANIPTSSDNSISNVVDICYKKTPATPAPVSSCEASSSNPLAQAEPEPMETDAASSERASNDPLDNGEEIPTTFPGHEELLSDWVPIIARDGARQRRHLSLGLSGNSVTSLSDAYLATMPNKRRKIVEHQKPLLLTNSTSNHAVIPSSMERLVRESVRQAGVAEVEGSAAAVAADPTVRRAFGQAIRECLDPRRYQTPDFPDSRRFPNATRFFADQDRSPNQ